MLTKCRLNSLKLKVNNETFFFQTTANKLKRSKSANGVFKKNLVQHAWKIRNHHLSFMESLFQIAYRPGSLQLRLMENMLKMSSPTYILHSHSAAKVYTDFPFKVNLYSLSEHFPCIWIDCSYLLNG